MVANSDKIRGLQLLSSAIVGAVEFGFVWLLGGLIFPNVKVLIGAMFWTIPPGLVIAVIILIFLFLGGITTVVAIKLIKIAKRKYKP